MPVYAILKSHSDKLHFINDHLSELHSLNDGISKADVRMLQDTLQNFEHNLLYLHKILNSDTPL